MLGRENFSCTHLSYLGGGVFKLNGQKKNLQEKRQKFDDVFLLMYLPEFTGKCDSEAG